LRSGSPSQAATRPRREARAARCATSSCSAARPCRRRPPSGVEEAYCPRVGVIEGGAALQAYAGRTGDPNALRNQISLTDFARECVARPDGATLVKVGIEGRALLGPGASAGGRFEAPVRVVIKSGDGVSPRAPAASSVTIPAGDTQGSFVVVEETWSFPPAAASSRSRSGSAARVRRNDRRAVAAG
jgi:hypothetical protein